MARGYFKALERGMKVHKKRHRKSKPKNWEKILAARPIVTYTETPSQKRANEGK